MKGGGRTRVIHGTAEQAAHRFQVWHLRSDWRDLDKSSYDSMLLIWKQILENPVYQKKGRASGCIKSKNRSLFLDIGLKVNIHNAYTQKQTKKPKKQPRTLRSTYYVWTLKIFRKWSSLKITPKRMPQLPKNRTCTFVGFYTLIRFLFVISIH